MYLSDYSQNAARAQQARRRIRYLGTTPNGNKLWTPKEDELCQEYGSDYAVLAKSCRIVRILRCAVAAKS